MDAWIAHEGSGVFRLEVIGTNQSFIYQRPFICHAFGTDDKEFDQAFRRFGRRQRLPSLLSLLYHSLFVMW